MSTIDPVQTNKVLRFYELLMPPDYRPEGRPVPNPTIVLRYTEDEAFVLHRDSPEAHTEALEFARREKVIAGDVVPVAVRCIDESLRRKGKAAK